MIKHLYAIGESCMYGYELGDSLNPKHNFTDYQRKYSFTGIIANKCNIPEYTNASLPGASNDRTLRVLYRDITRLLNSYTPDEIYVIIGMAHASRSEFYNSFTDKYVQLRCTGTFKSDRREEIELWKLYTSYFDSTKAASIKFNTTLFSIQTFLQHKNIKYFITKSLPTHYIDTSSDNVHDIIASMFDISRVTDDNFIDFVTNLKLPITDMYHPLEAGHAAWADFVLEKIKNKDLDLFL